MLKHKVVAEREAKCSLLTVDELLHLETHRAVVFMTGHYPIDDKKSSITKILFLANAIKSQCLLVRIV